MKRAAVFFDRDGTLIDERGYLGDPDRLHFYPSAIPALRRLQKAGFLLVVVSNQSGVARGFFSMEDLAAVNARFLKILRRAGVRIAGTYFCPHAPDAGCACRKPRPGLPRRAARELGIDLKKSYVVGDQSRDMELARAIGASGLLVMTGGGRAVRPKASFLGAKTTSNAATAAAWILARPRGQLGKVPPSR